MKELIAVVTLAGSCLLMTGCAEDTNDEPTYDPTEALETQGSLAELGPYDVGVTRGTVRYKAPGQAAVAANNSAEDDELREVPIIIWYPGEDASEDAKGDGVTLAGIVPLPTRGYQNLRLATRSSYPFAVYSHGSGGEASLAYPYGEQLASHGWIVASVDHVGNTTTDALGDPLDVPMHIPIDRMLDISAVIDAAEGGFDFVGNTPQIDTDHTFVFGHSLGGYTALALGGAEFRIDGARALVCEGMIEECDADNLACGKPNEEACDFLDNAEVEAAAQAQFRDERVVAIGLQAPGAVGMIDPSTVEVPAIMFTGDQDGWLPYEREAKPIWAALDNPDDLWLRFADAGHLSFITMCDPSVLGPELVSGFMPAVADDGCDETYINPVTMATINAAYLMAFAEKHVLKIDTWDTFLEGQTKMSILQDVDVELSMHDE